MINGDYILVVAPDDYPGQKYRDKYCYEHHLNFWLEYGFLPRKGEVIHHKDGNKHNNNINNLVLLTEDEHKKLHGKETLKHFLLLRCPVCGTIFSREKRNTHIVKHGVASFCSKECAYKANALRAKKDESFLNGIKNNIILEYLGKMAS